MPDLILGRMRRRRRRRRRSTHPTPRPGLISSEKGMKGIYPNAWPREGWVMSQRLA
jgi:hypothetical protein